MQIERILHAQGFGSRKQCRALVQAGRVRIAGRTVADPHQDFPVEDLDFTVDEDTWHYRDKVYVMLHKPVGYECSRQPSSHPSIFSLLPEVLANRGVQPVGRLDQDTTGLLLLSDDGHFIHAWSSGKKRVPKNYEVTTRHPVSDETARTLCSGVQLHDEPAPIRAAACSRLGERRLSLTVTEGKYHQVKRMVAAAGNRVEALHRTSVGGLILPEDLAPGAWRWLGEAELQRLTEYSRDPA